MLNIPGQVRVYVCTAATDMRKSYDGLSAIVTSAMKLDPLSGHLFLFLNRRRDRIKLMWWDRDGIAIWMKRLEQGSYQLPAVSDDSPALEIDATDLAMMLSGVDLTTAKRRKRYSRVA
jgi:transposase